MKSCKACGIPLPECQEYEPEWCRKIGCLETFLNLTPDYRVEIRVMPVAVPEPDTEVK